MTPSRHVPFSFLVLSVIVVQTLSQEPPFKNESQSEADFKLTLTNNSCYDAFKDASSGHFSRDGRIKIILQVRDLWSKEFGEASRINNDTNDSAWYQVSGDKEVQISCLSLSQLTLKYRGLLPNRIENGSISRQTTVIEGNESFCFALKVILKSKPSATGTYECLPNENDGGVQIPLDKDQDEEVTSSESFASVHLFLGENDGRLPSLVRPRNPGIVKIAPGSESGSLVVPCLLNSPIDAAHLSLHKIKYTNAPEEVLKVDQEGVSYHPTLGFLLNNSSYTCGDTLYCYDGRLPRGIETQYKVTCPSTEETTDFTIGYKSPNGTKFHECHNVSKVTLIECQSRLECELMKPCVNFGGEDGCHYDVKPSWTCPQNSISELCTAQFEVPQTFRGLLTCSNDKFLYTTYFLSDVKGARVRDIDFSSGLSAPTRSYPRWISSIPSVYKTWNNVGTFPQYEKNTFECKVAKIYGAIGIQWMFQLGSGERVPAIISGETVNETMNCYISHVIVHFNRTDITKLICRGPRINSASSIKPWHEASANIVITPYVPLRMIYADGEGPIVNKTIPAPQVTSKSASSDQKKYIITCNASGNSVRFTWSKNHKPLLIGSHNHFQERAPNNTLYSSIQIYYDRSEMGTDGLEDIYSCTATDVYSKTVSRQFNILWYTHKDPFPFDILASSIAFAVVVCVIVAAGIMKCFKDYWDRKNKAALYDILSEFRHGLKAKKTNASMDNLVADSDPDPQMKGFDNPEYRYRESSNTKTSSLVSEEEGYGSGGYTVSYTNLSGATTISMTSSMPPTKSHTSVALTVSVDDFWDGEFDNKFELKPHQVKVSDTKLGEGHFGIVHRGTLDKVVTVAVKEIKLKHRICNQDVARDILMEAKTLSNLGGHAHVVKFHGVQTNSFLEDGNVRLVLEYCEHGCIEKYLRYLGDPANVFNDEFNGNISPPSECGIDYTPIQALSGNSYSKIQPRLSTSDLFKWSHQIAAGMEYLASKLFIHRDLAARNILLDSNLNAKITDFGLSRGMKKRSSGTGYYLAYNSKEGANLPVQYLAPETLNTGSFTVQTDVWSFGVTLWEMFGLCRSEPYRELNVKVRGSAVITYFLANGGRLIKPDYASDELYRLIRDACWHAVPSMRPSFAQLKDAIVGIASAASLNTESYAKNNINNKDSSKTPLGRNDSEGYGSVFNGGRNDSVSSEYENIGV